NEVLTESERYDRAFGEVASAHNLTVEQLRHAISAFSARVSRDAKASDFDKALAMIGQQDFADAEIRAEQAVKGAALIAENASDDQRRALLLLGDIQMAQLKYSAAESSYRKGLAIVEQQNILFAADAGWRFSYLLAILGRYEEGVAVAEPILEHAEQHFGEPGKMLALNRLVLAVQGAGRYEDGVRVVIRAVEVSQ